MTETPREFIKTLLADIGDTEFGDLRPKERSAIRERIERALQYLETAVPFMSVK
jgi:hypothetical protein